MLGENLGEYDATLAGGVLTEISEVPPRTTLNLEAFFEP